MKVIPGVLLRRDPGEASAPVVYDIPRSGTWYPCEFIPAAPFVDLHQSVSMHVQDLYGDVVDSGASWLYATFPNTYIDANRHEGDIDPGLLDAPWPGTLETTEKSRLGIGLIHSKCGKRGVQVYDGKLRVQDVQRRLERYYWPYHNELSSMLAERKDKFGLAYHISCHSMASVGGPSTLDHGKPRSDFDIGDRHGASCDPALSELIVSTLSGFGYRVTRNFHYAGAESVRKHAQPAQGIHSLQIEIKRGLYMNEDTFELSDDFPAVRKHLSELAHVVSRFALENAPVKNVQS
ncbi:N-formylglutamate amidohydrolase [Bordetella sp. BOR01]|uniref:N-formylglutamate amidohydrolase n=1 Tax=Bordetella sp. BOR01 TaxID=2854779 RepID=UPI001C46ADA4|nr:N-formylglutamate amidohydrolase [Bordetella sp. BOR01]MBV7481512.1 N-formylglutamate amidohydrolase [Bordetella sp. BOR01]